MTPSSVPHAACGVLDDDLMKTDVEWTRGDVIGGAYVLDDLVGVGGMGVVFRAVQRSLGSSVVVKLPRSDRPIDRHVRHRFRTEALAGARIAHYNVARVLDYGEDRSGPFLVMEHVVGPRLGAVDHGLTLASAIDLVCQLLGALAELHAAGVVHGDIKCDNVLVETTRDGHLRPRLIDFGLARVMSEPWVSDGFIADTPEYLAPELVLGTPPTITSDIYSIGIVLYELVTGTTPFQGGTVLEVMQRQLDEDVGPVASVRPSCPAQLDDVITRATSKFPAERFPDASAFLAALRVIEPHDLPAPAVFSTDASTVPLPLELPAGSNRRGVTAGELARQAATRAAEQRDVTGFLVAHLELARLHIEDHDLASAIRELEGATYLAGTLGPAASEAPLWRMQLMLAGLYDWRGNRTRALRVALAARAQALRIGSAVGRNRANELLFRLGRASTKGPRPDAW